MNATQRLIEAVEKIVHEPCSDCGCAVGDDEVLEALAAAKKEQDKVLTDAENNSDKLRNDEYKP